jgi:tRNA pseudouridine55 synthase
LSVAGGLDGLLLVDKPAGPTSHDIVHLARRSLKTTRIGHTGTLDPLASGLIILVLGRATRLASFLSSHDKCYEGSARLGFGTTTYDRTGAPLGVAVDATGIVLDEIESVAATLRGESLQTPPPYSARKVGGERLYRRARRGQPVTAASTPIRVDRFHVTRPVPGEILFETRVSAGTYVRALVHDLGRRLGCGAHLSELRRTAIGTFRVDDALPLARIIERPLEVEGSPAFLHFDRVPLDLPLVEAADSEVPSLLAGRPFRAVGTVAPPEPLDASRRPSSSSSPLRQVRDRAGRLLGLATPGDSEGVYLPRRVFLPAAGEPG